jgi:hypothetical protein
MDFFHSSKKNKDWEGLLSTLGDALIQGNILMPSFVGKLWDMWSFQWRFSLYSRSRGIKIQDSYDISS